MMNEWMKIGVVKGVELSYCVDDEGLLFKFENDNECLMRFCSDISLDNMSGRDMLIWLDSYVELCINNEYIKLRNKNKKK